MTLLLSVLIAKLMKSTSLTVESGDEHLTRERNGIAPGISLRDCHMSHVRRICPETGRLFNFLRNNLMFKTKLNIKITNNNRNRNSNKLLKVQLLLKELFILAITNIHVRYGSFEGIMYSHEHYS